jgi:surface protein
MFSYCKKLTSLDSISNWDVSNVADMSRMFYNCTGLTSIDLSNWDISNVTNMENMFNACHVLTKLRMGGNPSSLTTVNNLFGSNRNSGSFYYNSAYDYSKILSVLPSSWTAIPCTLVDGVLVPNE